MEARDKFRKALDRFQEINDCRNVAGTYVHLARAAYRQGDHEAAMGYLEEGKSISNKLNIAGPMGWRSKSWACCSVVAGIANAP